MASLIVCLAQQMGIGSGQMGIAQCLLGMLLRLVQLAMGLRQLVTYLPYLPLQLTSL